MPLTPTSLREALDTLGAILADRGHSYDIVVIGGGALQLVGLIDRPTKDLDVVAPAGTLPWTRADPHPGPLLDAVKDVALALELEPDWLNPGPTDLLDLGLPPGFAERTTAERFGALTVRYAAREDQIAFKLYAAADHWPDEGKHLQDLRALTPTTEELRTAALWCMTHDPSPGFRDMLLQPVLAKLGVPEVPDA
jgi:hypothetical protein